MVETGGKGKYVIARPDPLDLVLYRAGYQGLVQAAATSAAVYAIQYAINYALTPAKTQSSINETTSDATQVRFDPARPSRCIQGTICPINASVGHKSSEVMVLDIESKPGPWARMDIEIKAGTFPPPPKYSVPSEFNSQLNLSTFSIAGYESMSIPISQYPSGTANGYFLISGPNWHLEVSGWVSYQPFKYPYMYSREELEI